MQPTSPAEDKTPPRIGIIGHLTRISNKLILLGNNNSAIQEHLQVYYDSVMTYYCLIKLKLLYCYLVSVDQFCSLP